MKKDQTRINNPIGYAFRSAQHAMAGEVTPDWTNAMLWYYVAAHEQLKGLKPVYYLKLARDIGDVSQRIPLHMGVLASKRAGDFVKTLQHSTLWAVVPNQDNTFTIVFPEKLQRPPLAQVSPIKLLSIMIYCIDQALSPTNDLAEQQGFEWVKAARKIAKGGS